MGTPRRFSFRDQSATVYRKDSSVFRFISRDYEPTYKHLMDSGLYTELVRRELLVEHEETTAPTFVSDLDNCARVIKPVRIPFVSYPYEWSFSQLQDAALLTLKVQKLALQYGMTLKDANAWNVQFCQGKPVFIDTSSFEMYKPGRPWGAYGQFCRFFLMPLVLMARREIRLNRLLLIYPDGIPLDLGVSLLPWTVWTDLSLAAHLLATAVSHGFYKTSGKKSDSTVSISGSALPNIIEHLEDTVAALRLKDKNSVWGDYYKDNTYSDKACASKQKIVEDVLSAGERKTVWDLGANTGVYSRIAARHARQVLSMDYDALCVERNYRALKSEAVTNILPLLMDCASPSPAIGWALSERLSLPDRGPCDMLLALALIHHLPVGNSIDFEQVSDYFAAMAREVLVEFVPREDEQVVRLMKQRTNYCLSYTRENFERAFLRNFRLVACHQVEDSNRTLYHFERL